MIALLELLEDITTTIGNKCRSKVGEDYGQAKAGKLSHAMAGRIPLGC